MLIDMYNNIGYQLKDERVLFSVRKNDNIVGYEHGAFLIHLTRILQL